MLKQHLICWGHCTQQWSSSGGLCLERLGTEWGGLLVFPRLVGQSQVAEIPSEGKHASQEKRQRERGLQIRKSCCVRLRSRCGWLVAEGTARKGMRTQWRRSTLRNLESALEEIGVIRGHSVPCWDGNGLKARPPKAGSCSGPTRGQSISEMGISSSEMGTSSD